VNKYHEILRLLEKRALITNSSLGILNSVQRVIFGGGLTANMMLAAHYVKKEIMQVGDVVLIQTLMLQLFNPLNMLGMMYRSVTESYIDLKCFIRIMNEKPWIVQSPSAKPLG
jgi:ATP-binding cassette subfamily B protein